MALKDLPLVDIYLGHSQGVDFCDVKELPGADAPRRPMPEVYAAEIAAIRAHCVATYQRSGGPEFAYTHDGVQYRVTAFDHVGLDAPFFTLSRVVAQIYPFRRLALPSDIAKTILDKNTRGLVVFCGSMSSGKTSSAASSVVGRLQANGGLALALEDPVETGLDGVHGEGRCIQVNVSRYNGGYREALIRALRARVGTILVGEIRDEETAAQVLRVASTDHLVITTMHAETPQTAVELLYTYAKANVDNAAGLVARCLSVVVWQQLTRRKDGVADVSPECLTLMDPRDQDKIRAAINDRAFENLRSLIKEQQDRMLYAV